MRDISFKPYGEDFQYLFFQTYNHARGKYDSVAWRITKDGIEEQKGDVGYYVWKKKVLPRKAKVLGAFFKINVVKAVPPMKESSYELNIVDDRSLVLKFLIQTCRVHWRVELEERLGIMSRLKTVTERTEYAIKNGLTDEDVIRIFHPANTEGSDYVKEYREKFRFSLEGEMLTEVEKEEQRKSFINRVYAIGYMMHRFKNPSKPWGLWVMDGKIADETESHGGSGKSLLTLFFKNINMAMVNLDGRNAKLTANPHIFENVDATTDVVNVDDLCDYFDFNFFFSPLTSTMPVNPKNKQGFELSHAESPKLMFSSNYGDRSTDPSSLRRKLYTIYSDYYHENNGDYRETRKPDEELGGNLFMNWPDSEWELFYNFMAQCLSFYLGCDEKIMPPMGNVQKRNLISQMSEQFKAWADIYFDAEGDKVNRWVMKSEAFDDFMKQTNAMKSHTVHLFKKKLQIYCKYMRYDFNPETAGSNIHKVDKKDSSGNYVRDKDDKVGKTTAEHVFVSTGPLSRKKEEGVPTATDDMPF